VQREEIKCTVTSIETNEAVHLGWSWDGKSFGPSAPDLKPVPGAEKNGNFVFDINATILATERQ